MSDEARHETEAGRVMLEAIAEMYGPQVKGGKHVIEVDEWMWDWAQRRSGKKRPSRYLRAMLGAAIMREVDL